MDRIIGEIFMFAGEYTPAGCLPCDGRRLNVKDYKSLFFVIGDKYTVEPIIPDTFCLPKNDGYYIVYDGLFPVE